MSRDPLKSRGKEADAASCEILYGKNPVQLFLQKSPRKAFRVWLDRRLDDETRNKFARLARGRSAEVRLVDRGQIDRLTGRAVHQGVAVEAQPLRLQNPVKLSGMVSNSKCCFLAVDGVTDPQNFGAICRSAEAMGVSGVIFEAKRSPPLGGAAYKASAGALDFLAVFSVPSLTETLRQMKSKGVWLIGLDARAARSLADEQPRGRMCLIVGSEDHGLRPGVQSLCDITCVIPMKGKVGSLNVSAAASAAIFWWAHSSSSMARF